VLSAPAEAATAAAASAAAPLTPLAALALSASTSAPRELPAPSAPAAAAAAALAALVDLSHGLAVQLHHVLLLLGALAALFAARPHDEHVILVIALDGLALRKLLIADALVRLALLELAADLQLLFGLLGEEILVRLDLGRLRLLGGCLAVGIDALGDGILFVCLGEVFGGFLIAPGSLAGRRAPALVGLLFMLATWPLAYRLRLHRDAYAMPVLL
jgi:hypothetical protein